MVHTTPITVRFRDQDALGHVNNAVYSTYLEQSRIDFFDAVFGKDAWLEVGVILAKLDINFRQPVKVGDAIRVETYCTHLGTKSFHLTCKILKKVGNDDVVMTDAHTVLVTFDYEMEQAKAIPTVWRERLAPFVVTAD